MRRVVHSTVATVLVCFSALAQGQDWKAEMKKKVDATFVLTKATADRTDIVTPGSVVVLQKDGLVMFGIDSKYVLPNTYKEGKFATGFGAPSGLSHGDRAERKFVAGEKFWVVGSVAKDDGFFMVVYSDPYNDVRYYGEIKFPFNKKEVPSADDMFKRVSEVLTVEPDTPEVKTGAPAQPVMAPIAAPPPPPDAPPAAPKTIGLGQSKDLVIANFGQPQNVVKLGTKEIYYYTDMKVTFVNGKVTDVQ